MLTITMRAVLYEWMAMMRYIFLDFLDFELQKKLPWLLYDRSCRGCEKGRDTLQHENGIVVSVVFPALADDGDG